MAWRHLTLRRTSFCIRRRCGLFAVSGARGTKNFVTIDRRRGGGCRFGGKSLSGRKNQIHKANRTGRLTRMRRMGAGKRLGAASSPRLRRRVIRFFTPRRFFAHACIQAAFFVIAGRPNKNFLRRRRNNHVRAWRRRKIGCARGVVHGGRPMRFRGVLPCVQTRRAARLRASQGNRRRRHTNSSDALMLILPSPASRSAVSTTSLCAASASALRIGGPFCSSSRIISAVRAETF